MRESSLTRSILKALQRRGGFWFKVHGHPGQRRGIPDIIGCYKGRFIGLELKVPDRRDRVTELQRQVLEEISQAGGIGQVVTSKEEALRVLDKVDSE